MLPHDKFDVIYFSHPNGKLLNDQHTDIVIPDFKLKNFVSVDVVIVQWQCIDFVVLFSYDYIKPIPSRPYNSYCFLYVNRK